MSTSCCWHLTANSPPGALSRMQQSSCHCSYPYRRPAHLYCRKELAQLRRTLARITTATPSRVKRSRRSGKRTDRPVLPGEAVSHFAPMEFPAVADFACNLHCAGPVANLLAPRTHAKTPSDTFIRSERYDTWLWPRCSSLKGSGGRKRGRRWAHELRNGIRYALES